MSPAVAHELFLTGRTFDVGEAQRNGLITSAVPADGLGAAMRETVNALVLGGPRALAVTKQLRRWVPGGEWEDVAARLLALSAEHFGSEEGRAGIAALREKRPAPWIPSRSCAAT
jgi:methylglutaconyl-CoA hydratase